MATSPHTTPRARRTAALKHGATAASLGALLGAFALVATTTASSSADTASPSPAGVLPGVAVVSSPPPSVTSSGGQTRPRTVTTAPTPAAVTRIRTRQS